MMSKSGIYRMTVVEYARLKQSERHHFLHLNSTSHTADGAHYHIAFSSNVARMLREELGIEAVQIHKNCHPDGAVTVSPEDLRATALNAPGFNHPKKT